MTWPDWSTRPEPVSDDDAITREEAAARRSHQARVLAEIRARRQMLQDSAPYEARHTGDDGGQHHWPEGAQRLKALVDARVDDDDPLDVLGRQALDQVTAYEQQQAEYAQQEADEARSWLEAHRPRNVHRELW